MISVSVYLSLVGGVGVVAGVVHIGLSLSLSRVSVSVGVVIRVFSTGLFGGSDEARVLPRTERRNDGAMIDGTETSRE